MLSCAKSSARAPWQKYRHRKGDSNAVNNQHSRAHNKTTTTITTGMGCQSSSSLRVQQIKFVLFIIYLVHQAGVVFTRVGDRREIRCSVRPL